MDSFRVVVELRFKRTIGLAKNDVVDRMELLVLTPDSFYAWGRA